jgi:hypothetical protein
MPKHKQAGHTTVLTKKTAKIARKRLQCRSHPHRTFVWGHGRGDAAWGVPFSNRVQLRRFLTFPIPMPTCVLKL